VAGEVVGWLKQRQGRRKKNGIDIYTYVYIYVYVYGRDGEPPVAGEVVDRLTRRQGRHIQRLILG